MRHHIFTTPSILLRSRDVGEADRLYTFYTRDHGKIEALATGVRKIKSKLAGHVVEYAIIRATFFPGRTHTRLVQASVEQYWRGIESDIAAFAVSSYAREALDALTKPGITDALIFDLLERLFIGLTKRAAAPHLLLHAFLFHFLSALGERPSSRVPSRVTPVTLLQEHCGYPLASETFLAQCALP